MRNSIKVINPYDMPFYVRLRKKGDSWGRNNMLVHDEDEPVVEVFTERGFKNDFPFSSYYLSTFMGVKNGLQLEGSEPLYSFNSANMKEIKEWIEKEETK